MTGVTHLILLVTLLVEAGCLCLVLRNTAATVGTIKASQKWKSSRTQHLDHIAYRCSPSLTMLNFMGFSETSDKLEAILADTKEQLMRIVDRLQAQVIARPPGKARPSSNAETNPKPVQHRITEQLSYMTDVGDVGMLFDQIPAYDKGSVNPLQPDSAHTHRPQSQQGVENHGNNNESEEKPWGAVVEELRGRLSAVNTAPVITDRAELLEWVLRSNEAYLAAIQSMQDQCIVNGYTDEKAPDMVTVELTLMYAKAVKALAYKNKILCQPPTAIADSSVDNFVHNGGADTANGSVDTAADDVDDTERERPLPAAVPSPVQAQQYQPAATPPGRTADWGSNGNSDSSSGSSDRRGKRLEREGDKYVYK